MYNANITLQYDRMILTIEAAIQLHLQNIEGGMERLSTIASAEAATQKNDWPFVTVPSFEVIGASVREQTGFEIVTLMPFVARSQVEAWERYSSENARSWLKESREIAQSMAIKANASGEYSSFIATEYRDGGPSPFLVDLEDPFAQSTGVNFTVAPSVIKNPDGPYLPLWMETPPPFDPTVININFLSLHPLLHQLISSVIAARRPLLSAGSMDASALSQTGITLADHERYHASLVNYRANGTESTFQHPHCLYLHPIFDEARNRDSAIVGMLGAMLPFDRYLVNLLPRGVGGIHAVLRNHRLQQKFTYRLDGNSVSRQEQCRLIRSGVSH
jgi:hypothetical protein